MLIATPEHNISAPVGIIAGSHVGSIKISDVLHHGCCMRGTHREMREPDGYSAIDPLIVFEEPAQIWYLGRRRLDMSPAIVAKVAIDSCAERERVRRHCA